MGARHITPQEVVEMHRLYKELGTYAAVAERIGRSASSVARYIKWRKFQPQYELRLRICQRKKIRRIEKWQILSVQSAET